MEKYINSFTEIAKFTKKEYQDYEDSLKYYRDLQNSLNTAKEEGKEEGRAEGRLEGKEEGKKEKAFEIARNLLKNGVDIEVIIQSTGLTKEEITKLQ